MPQDYRREGSGRWRDDRAERSDWNRNRLHDDQHRRDANRFSPHQDANFNQDRDSDRSYFAESSDFDRRDDQQRSASGWRDHGESDRQQQTWRRTEASGDRYWNDPRAQRHDRDDPGLRYERSSNRRPADDARMMQWGDDRDDGGYFGTGSYSGAYSTGPSSRASGSFSNEHSYLGYRNPMWRDEPASWRDDDARSAGSSGDSHVYAGSSYGAQGGFDRPYTNPSRPQQREFGQDYRERFAEQRYGRQPEFGYGFSEGGTTTFRGRGPKGYERSDERLREIVCERLTDDPHIDASDVHIEVKDKVVKLTGHVPDRRTKYEIEDVVEHCGGIKDIDNQVRVRSGSGITPTSGTAMGHTAASNSNTNEGSSTSTASRSKRNS